MILAGSWRCNVSLVITLETARTAEPARGAV
jgi:hypothetical protein